MSVTRDGTARSRVWPPSLPLLPRRPALPRCPSPPLRPRPGGRGGAPPKHWAGARGPGVPGPDQPELGAGVWLQSIEGSWRQELASTSLRDVQRLVDAAVDQDLEQPEARVH